ncbi:CDP-2,3-bis-(O-geranylgeranyl)-sn-glycerol synthase [Candidatus Woesearchaeota archaeon]|nr:CDP-2,3-bis-(O-geranylgeranyl)-sn-glycerol synthase [Candidatus Woesearchaeota archaeon]
MQEAIFFLTKCLYLMMPVYFANMAPVLVKKHFKFLDIPVDMGKKFKGKPILGSHKTVRGFVFGVFAGIAVAYIQNILYVYDVFRSISFVDYSNWLLLGFLLGFGALFGDSVKSFFKRRADVKPGDRFIPWDQIDYSIGSLVFVSFIFVPSWQAVLTVISINIIIHMIANHAAYYLGITKVKW